MRTAEEILDSVLDGAAVLNRQDAIAVINKAREEAIRECADVAVAKNDFGDDYPVGGNPIVDKQSILSLIPLLK